MGMETEFYGPFAHIPGRLEWCRIRSPTHGVFYTCIVIEATTSDPVTVYVNAEAGERFMKDRFPDCKTIRVGPGALRMEEFQDGHHLHCRLTAAQGPLRSVDMTFTAQPGVPREVPYGGENKPVWGSKYTCTGIDLELDAVVAGDIGRKEGVETLRGASGILTVGSMGQLSLIA